MADNNWYVDIVLWSTQKKPADPDLTMEPGSSRSATSESSSGSALSEFIFMLDDISRIISCLYTLSVAMRQPVPLENTLRLTCHTMNFLTTSMSLKSSLTQHCFSLSDSEVQTRNGDSISNIGGSITKQLQGGSLIRQHFQGLRTQAQLHIWSQHTMRQILYMYKRTQQQLSQRLKHQPQLQLFQRAPCCARSLYLIHMIEAEGTSLGTAMETGLLKVPDPSDADAVFAGNAFSVLTAAV